MNNWISRLVIALVLVALSPSAQACAACFGQNDGPLAKGMNAGIFTLLGVVGLVLVGFFVDCLMGFLGTLAFFAQAPNACVMSSMDSTKQAPCRNKAWQPLATGL